MVGKKWLSKYISMKWLVLFCDCFSHTNIVINGFKKRVITRINHYTHGMIGQTPFSLAIALPEPYGSYRLTSQVDLRMKYREENFTHYFRGNQWRVHPEWVNIVNLFIEPSLMIFFSGILR